MIKFRENKWKYEILDDVFIKSKSGKPICEIPSNGIYDYSDRVDNAALIAASPELLSTLQTILEDIKRTKEPEEMLKWVYTLVQAVLEKHRLLD